MANAAAASWTATIGLMQQWMLQPPTDVEVISFVNPLNQQLDQLGTLPRAAWKRLSQDVQVTRQLAALCIQVQQQASKHLEWTVYATLASWLQRVEQHTAAAPNSRLAASVRQQLQETALLQHMGAIFTEAADGLTAAATAVTRGGDAAPNGRGHNQHSNNRSRSMLRCRSSHSSHSSHHSRGSSTVQYSTAIGDRVPTLALASEPRAHGSDGGENPLNILKHAVDAVSHLLVIYHAACRVLSPGQPLSNEAALPAAQAAVRLIHTTFQTCSKLQQQLAADSEFQRACELVSGQALCLMLHLAPAVQEQADAQGSSAESSPQSSPSDGVRDVLRCPELAPCLATAVLAAALGLDTGAQGGASSAGGGDRGAVGSASSSSGTAGGSRRVDGEGSSSSTTSSSSGRLANGVSLDSLTPLSRSLFGLLGVEQGVLLQAVKGFGMIPWTESGLQPGDLDCLIQAYSVVLQHQVEQLQTPCGVTNAQLLLQLETDMLLGLAMQQLTASIPDNYPRAQEARELACQLTSSALYSTFNKTSLHQLPLTAAYTGPQLALQVMQSPLGPRIPSQQQEQQQPPEQQLQQLPCYTVTPTAHLLTELLPLLTSYCLAKVQQQHVQRQQLLEALRQDLQQAAGEGQAAGPQDLTLETSVGVLHIVQEAGNGLCPISVQQCMLHMHAVLSFAVVPDPNLTAAEVQAAADAAAAAAEASSAVDTPGDAIVTYRCILHNPDAVMQHVGELVHVLEALLREAAAVREVATWVFDDRQLAAAAAAAAEGGAAAAMHSVGSLIAQAENILVWLADFGSAITADYEAGVVPHQAPVLTLAALSAGPRSDLQRQLLSMLCSMAKIVGIPVHAAAAPHVSIDSCFRARDLLVSAAATSAAALVAGAADMQQRCLAGGSDSHAAAVAMLPGLFIIGRCCTQWAQQLPSGEFQERWLKFMEQDPEEPFLAELVLPPVQQWLQAGSNEEQLVAAGYAVQGLQQQLQQVLAALPAAKESGLSRQFDTVCFREAVQQLQAVGSALCSLAVPCLCNNPSCANLSGLTEVGLVSGRSCVCGGCRVARYCGRACQRAVWKQHKPLCAALAEAAAAGAIDADKSLTFS